MRVSPVLEACVLAAGAVRDVAVPAITAATNAVITTASAQAVSPCAPSRNSTKSRCKAVCQLLRSLPATYPPNPKLTIAVRTRYTPEASARVGEVSRQVGAVEATDRPKDVPKVISTSEKADATSAPAITGPQCRKSVRTSTGAVAISEVCMTGFLR